MRRRFDDQVYNLYTREEDVRFKTFPLGSIEFCVFETYIMFADVYCSLGIFIIYHTNIIKRLWYTHI